MSRTVDIDQVTDQGATGMVAVPMLSGAAGGTRKKIPTRGHYNWSLTTIAKSAGGAPNLVVKLKGTNNPDEADNSGEDLITNTHAGNGQKDGTAANKAYKYVFVEVTALADLVLDRVMVLGSGMAGMH